MMLFQFQTKIATRVSGIASLLFLACFLTACGGGGGSQLTQGPLASVSDIQVDRLSYSQISSFKILGTALSAGTALTLSADKCSSITVLSTSTDTEVKATCTVNGTGTLTFQAKNTSGNSLLTKTLTVPEPQVTLVTNLGSMVVELNPTAAPATVSNFLQYVHDGFYANTVFHRVIANFVAQGGGYTAAGAEQAGVRAAIALESNKGLSNARGTIAMARASAANSATSQFYFNLIDNAFLDYASTASPGYAVFGKLTQGLSVMDAMGSSATGTRFGMADFPLVNIVLQSAAQTQ